MSQATRFSEIDTQREWVRALMRREGLSRRAVARETGSTLDAVRGFVDGTLNTRPGTALLIYQRLKEKYTEGTKA